MRQQLQANIGFYGRTLESTGGALAWEKCKVYLIMFLWVNGVKIILHNKNDFEPLKVFSLLTGLYHFIKLANPDEAFRMLGAFVAPDGSTVTQVNILKEMTRKWADKLQRSYLTPHESLIAFKQVLFPAVVYPVAIMPLTEQECHDIMKPAIQALLKKLHMPQNTNRDLLYGPARYGGLDLLNLYVFGNVLKLMMFIGHFQKGDTTKPILQVALGSVQQQVGISTPVLETSYDKYSILVEKCWIRHIWKFLHEIGGIIHIVDTWVPESVYDNDSFIMERIMEMKLPIKTIQHINLCRIHKRMYFFTDLLDSKHTSLHPLVYHPLFQKEITDKFPVIELPKHYWHEWKNCIATLFASIRVSGFHAGIQIRKCNAMWLQRFDRQQLLFKLGPSQYRVFPLKTSARDKYIYNKNAYHETMYQDLKEFYCVTVTVGQEHFETDGFYEPATTITLPRGPRFFEKFHTLHQWMLSNIPHHKPTRKHKWDVFISEQIKAQLHKQEIQDFLTAIEQLPDALRRNIGGLHEIEGLTYLAQAIYESRTLGADCNTDNSQRVK